MKLDSFKQFSKSSFHIDWIVEDLISPSGWTFLVGETGTGKSMFCIQLCDALQEGKPFLDMKTSQRNCLYIQADAGTIEWQKQIYDLAKDSAAWTAHQLERGFLDNPVHRKRLHDIVWANYELDSPSHKALKGMQFTFIVFDCLHAITNRDINLKIDMSLTLSHLDEIVTRQVDGEIQRVHYLLIHHPNSQVKRGATAGSGHKGFSDACGTKLTLGGKILALEKSKITKTKEIELERNDVGAWYKASEPVIMYKNDDWAELVLSRG